MITIALHPRHHIDIFLYKAYFDSSLTAFWAGWIRMYEPDGEVNPPQPKEIVLRGIPALLLGSFNVCMIRSENDLKNACVRAFFCFCFFLRMWRKKWD